MQALPYCLGKGFPAGATFRVTFSTKASEMSLWQGQLSHRAAAHGAWALFYIDGVILSMINHIDKVKPHRHFVPGVGGSDDDQV